MWSDVDDELHKSLLKKKMEDNISLRENVKLWWLQARYEMHIHRKVCKLFKEVDKIKERLERLENVNGKLR